MKRLRPLQQAGDTIVEVLIALAVVGFLVGGAYVVTNRSTITERQAQERSDALGLAQTQIEAIRAASAASTELNHDFCMTNTGAAYSPIAATSGQVPPSAADSDTLTEYVSGCNFNASGTSGVTVQPVYHIFVNYNLPNGAASGIYTINVRWLAASGNANDNLILYYKAT